MFTDTQSIFSLVGKYVDLDEPEAIRQFGFLLRKEGFYNQLMLFYVDQTARWNQEAPPTPVPLNAVQQSAQMILRGVDRMMRSSTKPSFSVAICGIGVAEPLERITAFEKITRVVLYSLTPAVARAKVDALPTTQQKNKCEVVSIDFTGDLIESVAGVFALHRDLPSVSKDLTSLFTHYSRTLSVIESFDFMVSSLIGSQLLCNANDAAAKVFTNRFKRRLTLDDTILNDCSRKLQEAHLGWMMRSSPLVFYSDTWKGVRCARPTSRTAFTQMINSQVHEAPPENAKHRLEPFIATFKTLEQNEWAVVPHITDTTVIKRWTTAYLLVPK